MVRTVDECNKLWDEGDYLGSLGCHGERMSHDWTHMAILDPPKGIIERIFWSIGVLLQLLLSVLTFGAALGAFILEESVQSYGMGAYMLTTSKSYVELEPYLENYKTFINSAETGAYTLAFINPITGGPILEYMKAAKEQAEAFIKANNNNLLKQAETDLEARQKLLESQNYGSLRLTSTPDNAEIWLNDENTELVTPETFSKLDAGTYAITLRKYSAVREMWDIYSFDINIQAGRRKEVQIRIPTGITTDETEPEAGEEQDEPSIPDFINAEVTGDHAIDGDTFITITGERIRLLAIDAPEIGRPWGEEAKEALGLNIEDKKIELRIQTHKPLDEYGRTLAICRNYKGDLSAFQLSAGLATTFFTDDDIYETAKYITAEQIAKDRQIGIWS